MHNYYFLREIKDKGFTATTWQNLNNPVRSAGPKSNKKGTLKGFNLIILNPFRILVFLFVFPRFTGGYSHSSPAGFNKQC